MLDLMVVASLGGDGTLAESAPWEGSGVLCQRRWEIAQHLHTAVAHPRGEESALIAPNARVRPILSPRRTVNHEAPAPTRDTWLAFSLVPAATKRSPRFSSTRSRSSAAPSRALSRSRRISGF